LLRPAAAVWNDPPVKRRIDSSEVCGIINHNGCAYRIHGTRGKADVR
jgi:hypothetical protein